MDLLLDLAERRRVDLGLISILTLVELFVAAMARLADRVAIERRADWLVMATRLVLLRSRLLFPESTVAAEAAQRDAAAELRRIADLTGMRVAATWLGERPVLGQDVFARGAPGRPPVSIRALFAGANAFGRGSATGGLTARGEEIGWMPFGDTRASLSHLTANTDMSLLK